MADSSTATSSGALQKVQHLERKTRMAALDNLERDQLLMEAMGDLMRRSYLAVRRSEEKAFGEQGLAFEINNHFYKF